MTSTARDWRTYPPHRAPHVGTLRTTSRRKVWLPPAPFAAAQGQQGIHANPQGELHCVAWRRLHGNA